jgi:hypothetical protein
LDGPQLTVAHHHPFFQGNVMVTNPSSHALRPFMYIEERSDTMRCAVTVGVRRVRYQGRDWIHTTTRTGSQGRLATERGEQTHPCSRQHDVSRCVAKMFTSLLTAGNLQRQATMSKTTLMSPICGAIRTTRAHREDTSINCCPPIDCQCRTSVRRLATFKHLQM